MISIYIKRILLIVVTAQSSFSIPSDWDTVENIAEEYPYVVALLNGTKDYICTGTIIDSRTVLSSGSCVEAKPCYVAIRAAFFKSKLNNASIFKIASTRLHRDYMFDVHESEQILSRMHSNIGLIFTIQNILENFIEAAIVGNFYAPELKDKSFLVVGHGRIKKSKAIVLQQQPYQQIACLNPKWYYCICGIEYSDYLLYEEPFGEGGPVLYGDLVIGVASRPCGSLSFKANIKYNIFTVIGPYLPWIEQTKMDSIQNFRVAVKNSSHVIQVTLICLLLMLNSCIKSII